jgi:hypothetical protein
MRVEEGEREGEKQTEGKRNRVETYCRRKTYEK